MSRQQWQTMLNNCCLNGPVPTGRVVIWDDPSLLILIFFTGTIRAVSNNPKGQQDDELDENEYRNNCKK